LTQILGYKEVVLGLDEQFIHFWVKMSKVRKILGSKIGGRNIWVEFSCRQTAVDWIIIVQVIPRSNKNCTEEIPALHNGTEIFVDPTSYCT
jgi:hypothetical protein